MRSKTPPQRGQDKSDPPVRAARMSLTSWGSNDSAMGTGLLEFVFELAKSFQLGSARISRYRGLLLEARVEPVARPCPQPLLAYNIMVERRVFPNRRQ